MSIFKSLLALLAVTLVTGCQSPHFAYPEPATRLDPAGPTLTVLPIVDERTNRSMDKVLAKGYLMEIQRVVADEMRSLDRFRDVLVATNDTDSAGTSVSDFYLTPQLRRLEWSIPRYGQLQTKAFLVGLTTGLIGGGVYLSTGVDVEGHSTLLVTLRRDGAGAPNFERCYENSVTNRMKKASCDTPKTRMTMMSRALQQSLEAFKVDLARELPRLSTEASPSPDPEAVMR